MAKIDKTILRLFFNLRSGSVDEEVAALGLDLINAKMRAN